MPGAFFIYSSLMIHLPDGQVSAPEWQELAGKVTDGDGLVWAGDPTLWLGIGVIEQQHREVARRLEVWKHCADGADRLVGSWHPSEAFRVCSDLAEMRADKPGGSTVLADIDRHNEMMEKAAEQRIEDVLAEATEYMAKLHADTSGPRQTFRQVGGKRDEWPAS